MTNIATWSIRDGKGKMLEPNPVNNVYQIPADGIATATAKPLDPDAYLTYEIIGDPLNCTLNGNVVKAGKTPGTIRVRAYREQPVCQIQEFLIELTECNPCPSDDCGAFGSGSALNGSVDFKLGLGWSAHSGHAGFLHIKQAGPTLNLKHPTRLLYNFQRRDAHVVRHPDGALLQVKAPEGVANIVTNTAYKYTIELYTAANIVGKTNGLYLVTNTPLKSITVENPGNDTNQLRISDSSTGAVYDYQWLTNGCELNTGNGLRKERKTTVLSETNTLRTVTTTIQQGANPVVFQKVEAFRTNDAYGERLIQEIIGTGVNAMTNSYAYTSSGYLKQVTRADGTWEYYVYDVDNRPTNILSGFGTVAVTTNGSLCRMVEHNYSTTVIPDSGDDGTLDDTTPRMTVEYLLGQEVARRYKVILFGEKRNISCTVTGAAWNAPGNLVTITKLITTSFRHYEPQKITYPDGTVEIFQYGGSYTNTTNVVLKGHPDSSGTIDQGTKTVSVIGASGQVTSRTILDVASSGIIVSQEIYSYDSANRLTNTTYLDGTTSQSAHDCCTLSSTIDRDGTVTSYTYDALKRLLTSTRNGVTLSNVYDPAGNILQGVRHGTNGAAITIHTSTFDDASRLISRQDALTNKTSYTNYLTANGLVKTTTYPNLSTRTETYFRDGSLKSIEGTAVHGVRYDYGPTNNGRYTLELKLLANGADSSESVLRVSDMLNRRYQERFPDGAISQRFYNTNGQVTKTVDPDGVTTLYQYNSLGELEYTALDMDGGGMGLAGSDRVTQTISDVFANTTLGANVRRTRTYVWPDSSSTPQLLATVETSVDGLSNWNTLWNGGAAVVASTRTVYSGGHRYVTNAAFDGTYTVSDFYKGQLLSETRKGSDGNQIAATTYEYDEHGRLKKSTDARNGATTFTYDEADRLQSVTHPSPTSLGSGPATWYFYNSMGWVTYLALPPAGVSPVITIDYHLTGEVATNSGYGTPVAYTYDHAGRLKTMTTWTNFSSRQGAATTTWNYDAYRGFLTNKAYAGTNGPSYSYTDAGRLKSRTWARGVTCTYTTNAAGDIATVSYTDGTPGVTYTFDRLGRIWQVNHGTNVTILSYNATGQLLSEAHNGLIVSNRYSSLLLRTNLYIGTASAINNGYTYDPGARLSQVSDGTHSTVYQYEANSSLISTQLFKQGTTTRMTVTNWWDFWNRPAHHASMPAADVAVKYYYGHDLINRVTGLLREDSIGGVSTACSYDSLGQLSSAKRTWWLAGNPMVAGQQFQYGHDDIGNRRWAASGGNEWGSNLRYENYTANSLNQYSKRTLPGWINVIGSATNTATVTVNNQPTHRSSNYFRGELAVSNLTSAVWQGVTNIGVLNVGTNYDLITTNSGSVFVPQTPEMFGYDADGNLTSDGRWTMAWDGENRLVRMQSYSNGPAASRLTLDFAYDYRGRRISKTVSNWTSGAVSHLKFAYDDWNLVAEMNGTNNALLRSYMWGLDVTGTMQGARGVGGLVAIDDGTNGVHFAAHDGKVGNVVVLVNAADAKVSAQYDYGPFGEAIRAEGVTANANPIRFSTKYCDRETDWVYYGYRYYNPTIGRWASRDPIEELGGDNIYGYVRNSPASDFDIDGRQNMGWGGPRPGQPGAQPPDWTKWRPYPDLKPPTPPGFSSVGGFVRWLAPIGGGMTIAWADFDPTGQARRVLIQATIAKNRPELMRRIKEAPCGASTLPGMIWYDQDVFESPIAWISQYTAFASSAADPELDKDCASCRFSLKLRFHLVAEDRSDFNPGDRFYVGPVPIRDDILIFVRNWTPFGADYTLRAFSEESYETKGQY